MLIELENVTKTYGKVSALRGLSVALPEGAIGLLGPNGAGKTTMIRTLLGLIAIDSGEGRVLGMDIRTRAAGDPPVRGVRARGRVPLPRDERRVGSSPMPGSWSGCSPNDAMQRLARSARLRRPGRGALPTNRILFDRDEAAAQDRRGDRPRSAAADPRRADQWHGPGRPRRRPGAGASTSRDNKGMSLLFSSHLLPDVEAVCEYVMVLGGGRLLAQGRIDGAEARPQPRVRGPGQGRSRPVLPAAWRRGIPAEPIDEHILVQLPPGTH